MDTVIDITVVATKNVKTDTLWSAIDSLLKDWEQRFSQTNPQSEILAVNNRITNEVAISPLLCEMIVAGLAYGDTTDGFLDITVLPVKEIWGFGESADTNKHAPTQQQLDSALRMVGRKKVHVDFENRIVRFADSAVQIDLGGIAKGYALIRIELLLQKAGYHDYLIVSGGDIVAKGKRHDDSSWTIGIQHPRKPEGLLATFKLDSGCVVTSGDYERYWMLDGQRIHHIFNPYTGTSCTGNQSVTMWGLDPVELDFLSTGLFCKSAQEILTFINARPRLQGLIVDSAGSVHISNGWKHLIRLEPSAKE